MKKKINREMYQSNCDNVIQKIKVPHHLIMHGSSDTQALDLYCGDIVHIMKVAQSAPLLKRGFE